MTEPVADTEESYQSLPYPAQIFGPEGRAATERLGLTWDPTQGGRYRAPAPPPEAPLPGVYLPSEAGLGAVVPPPMHVNVGVVGHGPGIVVPPEVLERQRAADEARAREVEAARSAAQAHEADVKSLVAPTRPAPPKAPALPKAPDVGLRPFMTPAEHAQTGEVLRNFVGLLGATIGAFGGGSRHAAAGSLAALTGAMKGWSEGDRDRVNREIERWRTETERLLKQYELELDEYRSVVTDARLTWDQQVTAMNARAAVRENYRLVDSLNVQDKTTGLKELEDRWLAVEGLKTARDHAATQLGMLNAHITQWDRMADLREREVIVKEEQASAQVSDEELHDLVAIYGPRGRMPSFGMGKSAERLRYLKTLSADAKKYGGPQGLVMRQTALNGLGAEYAQVAKVKGAGEAFSRTASANLDMVLEMSEKVDRTGSPMLNKWILAGRKAWSGDPKVADYDFSMRAAITETARVLGSPSAVGVLSDTMRKEVDDVLNTSFTKEQVRAVVARAKRDMANRLKGYADELAGIQQEILTLAGPEKAGAPTAAPSGTKRKVLIGPDGKRYDGAAAGDRPLMPGWKLIEE